MKVYTKPEIEITELGPLSCIMDSDVNVIDDPSQPGGGSNIGYGGDGGDDDAPTNMSSIWED